MSLAEPRAEGPRPPLGADAALWERALRWGERVLGQAARDGHEPPVAALAVMASAARTDRDAATEIVRQGRRLLVRLPMQSEPAVRCLRALARAGAEVDAGRLAAFATGTGRLPRIALAGLAELAARDDDEAMAVLTGALESTLRADAAQLLSQVCSTPALDALSRIIRTPGLAGVHACAALVSAEEDPFALESLVERLCDAGEAVPAARALAGAAPEKRLLSYAEAVLARWAGRGVDAAETGRRVAAVFLTAAGVRADLEAVQRAIAAEDDELAVEAVRAAYVLGDAERARASAMAFLRRGPTAAAEAFRALVSWADEGDGRALKLVKAVWERRPIELGRAAGIEALAGSRVPALHEPVRKALEAGEPAVALEAARAVMRLREPVSVVSAVWL